MPPDLRDRVVLLLNELVTNAIQHGGADGRKRIEVRLSSSSGRVRVEVEEPGLERERLGRASDSGGGLGTRARGQPRGPLGPRLRGRGRQHRLVRAGLRAAPQLSVRDASPAPLERPGPGLYSRFARL
jgi:hypothetical protein